MGQWDFTPILKWQDVAALTNTGSPNLFTAWGCWNSYYVEPTIESLSARLLRELGRRRGGDDRRDDADHGVVASPLGHALLRAGQRRRGDGGRGLPRRQAGPAAAGWRPSDAIYGMTLLGDPAMSLPQVP